MAPFFTVQVEKTFPQIFCDSKVGGRDTRSGQNNREVTVQIDVITDE